MNLDPLLAVDDSGRAVSHAGLTEASAPPTTLLTASMLVSGRCSRQRRDGPPRRRAGRRPRGRRRFPSKSWSLLLRPRHGRRSQRRSGPAGAGTALTTIRMKCGTGGARRAGSDWFSSRRPCPDATDPRIHPRTWPPQPGRAGTAQTVLSTKQQVTALPNNNRTILEPLIIARSRVRTPAGPPP